MSCQKETSLDKKGRVKVTILYPNSDGTTFDMDYYSNKHMPMVADLMGEALKGLRIDTGISGRTPDDPIPYLAIGYLYFDSLEAYQEAFAPVAEKIVTDIPNYTNTRPIIQISEIVQ
ncbi:EthD family reductase [uncultured Dokdonia sp.]|uniref:EthD family reductase n=1 Tax=uncultured Dokdonia sp. TaxID=575653 RepID=UPI00263702B8|nr:EthD family reductase [uncultured Dokdonia sp.]